MIKKLLITCIVLLSTSVVASDESCPSGNCSTPSINSGATANNSPTLNNDAALSLSGSNVNVQQNFDNVSRVGEVQCGNTSWGGTLSSGENTTYPHNIRSNSFNAQLGVSGSFGANDNTCTKALKASHDMVVYKAQTLKFDLLDKKSLFCINLINSGFVVSNELKQAQPSLALCDHFRKVKKDNPTQYTNNVSKLLTAPLTKPQPIVRKLTLVGYKEYRIWLVNAGSCSKCGDDYTTLIRSLLDREIDRKDILVIPFQNKLGKMRYSVNIVGTLLTKGEAQKKLLSLREKMIYGTVRGVTGTGIYK